MTYDDAAHRWRGPPLALQISGLLVAGLVVSQLATLVLTLLLPPEPQRRHELEDIAKALVGGHEDLQGLRLMRALRSASPQPGGPGWLTSERSRVDLAQLLGQDVSAVRLFFYTPLPFAGTINLPPRQLGQAEPAAVPVAPALRVTQPRWPADGLMKTDYQVAQAGGGRGGGGGGWGGPGGGPGGMGGFGGPGGPGGGWEGGGMGRRDSGAWPERGQDGPRSSPSPRTDAASDAPMESSAPTAAVPSAPGSQGDAQSPTRSDPSPQPAPVGSLATTGPSSAEAGAGSGMNAGVQDPRGAELPSRPLQGQGSQASSTTPTRPSANAGVATPVHRPTMPMPSSNFRAGGNAPSSLSASGDESARRAMARPAENMPADAGAVTSSRPSTLQESAASPMTSPTIEPLDRRATQPSAAMGRVEQVDNDSVTPARGLFGLAPAPFVEGDFIAALHRPQGDWIVVQPVPEPFPNAWQRRVLLWFAIALALVAPAGWWFSRRLVRPIVGFARAAEQLGRDPRAPVLVRQGPAEIGRAAVALNGMQSRLRNFVEDRTAMIGAISHDLRTPLTRMRFRIEDVPDEVRAGMLDDVEEMEQMISSVLAFLRDAAEPGTRERLDLLSIVEDVVEDAKFTGKDVQLEHGEDVSVEVDAIGIRRVLNNLVDNAVKYGHQARVRLFVHQLEAVVEISDSGPGLPEDELVRVFQPFYRDRHARRSGKQGSGLGLAVCRSIARAHGGDVRLSNGPRGLIAQFSVPLSMPT